MWCFLSFPSHFLEGVLSAPALHFIHVWPWIKFLLFCILIVGNGSNQGSRRENPSKNERGRGRADGKKCSETARGNWLMHLNPHFYCTLWRGIYLASSTQIITSRWFHRWHAWCMDNNIIPSLLLFRFMKCWLCSLMTCMVGVMKRYVLLVCNRIQE